MPTRNEIGSEDARSPQPRLTSPEQQKRPLGLSICRAKEYSPLMKSPGKLARLSRLLLLALLLCGARGADQAAAENLRLRLIVETDAGGDPDDEQSLVRFLLYANEWDVEGIIASRPFAREGENRNRERAGLGIVQALGRAYGECWPSLSQHDPRYPAPAALMSRIVSGADDTTAAVDLIIAAVDRDDPRPVWYSDWGSDHGSATNNLRRALDRVLRERGQQGYARFKSRLRISGYDKFGDHGFRPPGWTLWVNTFEPPVDGRRWYHRFSALTAKTGGFDLLRDAVRDHGPLGALYPTNTTHWQKEGDSMTFLYLAPTGMNDPNEPGWGSWAGRYALRDDAQGRPYYWASAKDFWNGSTHRDNTLARWAAHLQNDFRARLDWCVKKPEEPNHPPRLVLNKSSGLEILRLRVRPGAEVILSGEGTSDPDGNTLRYEWFHYPEAGTWQGALELEGKNTLTAKARIPENAAHGKTIHIIFMATDDGEPALTRYRRAVIEVSGEPRN